MPAPKLPNEHKVSSIRPFGRITSHVDPMVLYTFLALLLVSIAILAFKSGSKVDCSDTGLSLASRQHGANTPFTVGEVITFKVTTPAGAANAGYSWKFGDSSAQQQGLQVYHAFEKAGSYTVVLESGKCTWRQELVVINPSPVRPLATAPPVADVFPAIEGPEEVLEGQKVTYSTSASNATSWEWRLEQANGKLYTDPSVSYTFAGTGERTLSLVVNGDRAHRVTKHITVFPGKPNNNRNQDRYEPPPLPAPETRTEPAVPTPAQPEKPKTPAISDDEFKVMLTALVNKQKTTTDFAAYLCDNLNARVLLNDKDTDTFTSFCSRIRGKKRFKIEVVNLIKDENGCVKEIRIRYDKKGLFGIF